MQGTSSDACELVEIDHECHVCTVKVQPCNFPLTPLLAEGPQIEGALEKRSSKGTLVCSSTLARRLGTGRSSHILLPRSTNVNSVITLGG